MRPSTSIVTTALVLTTAVFSKPVIELDRRATIPYWPFQSFKTAPFHPPVLNITKSGADLAPGYIFFGPGAANESAPHDDGTKETAPFIMTDTGELIWSGPRGTFSNNFQVQELDGEPVLTYWQGIELAGTNVGHYYGSVRVLNSSYHEIYKICPHIDLVVPVGVTHPCKLDGHESIVTDKGTLLVTAYNITSADLTPINGSANGTIWNCLFYEIDIKTSKILFTWSAIEHIPISATKNPLGKAGSATAPFDYFHINSVDPYGDGYLVNARHTWATYKLSSNGSVDWEIQGQTGGDFATLPAESQFRWQHDARVYNATSTSVTIRWFNNYNAFQANGTAPSNGLSLDLDLTTMTTSFNEALTDPKNPIYSDAQGNNQLLSNGNSLLYYGITPTAKEFGPSGDTRWTATFGYPNLIQSYRMFKQEWHAAPSTLPSVVVEAGEGYVSWNGATEVTEYTIYEGLTAGSLQKARTVQKAGFETSFAIGEDALYVVVGAFGAEGFLKNSSVVSVD